MKKSVQSQYAPKPIGPYSQAVVSGNTLYISGQLPYNAESEFLITTDISLATKQVMDNIGAILHAADMDFTHVVKCSIYVTDISKFAEVNAVYFNYFESPFPARETIQVAALPMGAMIEISAIAVK
ncbi:MAG TPA: Rid family detoxifying hydrolase [Bacteroidales bacterium]|jgi:2-iminobutanoate/2-iminopropanoate deaminase|nr:Rid family detoxifying hydrolase [Bacteroidales bacterium]HRS19993.1 Rid family detoxifying hydrolase [Bacteroidales bacterium]